MSILPIRTVPDPVLRTAAAPARPGHGGLQRLIEDMFETMDDVGGVGLAAPQVGVGWRVFTFAVEDQRGYVINPVLTTDGGPVTEPGEGCLSVPGLYYHPARAERATVTGVDRHGTEVEYTGEALLARCFQHEYDHLDGTLFVDRLTGDDRRQARRRMRAGDYTRIAGSTRDDRARTVSSSFGGAR